MTKNTNIKYKRLHLFEFEDQPWFPEIIRSGGTDYLRFLFTKSKMYQPSIPLIIDTLHQAGTNNLVDLCSGGGGYIKEVAAALQAVEKNKYRILLTDKFPNIAAFKYIQQNSNAQINYTATSVDVLNVPENIKGLRVLFSAIHHFKPAQVKQILQQSVKAKAPIAFFDGGEKNLAIMLAILILHPLALFFVTPFLKPFTFSRIFFTYVLPLIPLYTVWDGLVSILRLYSPNTLQQIANSIPKNNYVWQSGKIKNHLGIKITYLIGYQKKD